MPWYRWKDPAREGLEVEIRTTAGRTVKGRIVSHGAEVADLRKVDLARCDVQTTVIDEQGRYYTGREVARHAVAPPAAA
ncbi:MAG: hypothetical protein FJ027_24510 [Candidatus Rokubacteria bacterium]|nr:hypothetical protein [Candidatus Rokubacteria bacterium]